MHFKKFVSLSYLLFFPIIGICQSGWVSQLSGVNFNLNSIKFINNQTGYCVGDSGTVLKTSNGGNNWLKTLTGITENFKSIEIPGLETGIIVGENGITLKTTNSGINWINISFQSVTLNQVFFINNNVGFICGETNKIFKTNNFGISWDSIVLDFPTKNIFFINEKTGWASGSLLSGDAIYKTIDSGYNWLQIYFSPVGIIKSIFFIDSLNGWIGSPRSILGSVPNLHKTTNGGLNWFDPFRFTANISYSLYFTNIDNGWSAGDRGLIWHTSNSGVNWISQTQVNNDLVYRSIYFTDSLSGWVVGDSGVILKTTTGGVLTGFSNLSTEISDKFSLSQNYPNPFNPSTNLEFGISDLGFVSLKVFDVLGNEVATLVNENKPTGSYEVEFDGSNLPSGIYFYSLEVNGNIIDTKRMILLK